MVLPPKLISMMVPKESIESEMKFTRMKSAIAGADITIAKTSQGNFRFGIFPFDETKAPAKSFPQYGHQAAP
jgi:hypothetical protein